MQECKFPSATINQTHRIYRQASQDFDPDGNRISLDDPNNNRTVFTFDRAGRITARASASGSTVKYGYNAQNLLAQVTNGRGQAAGFQYDAAGRLTSMTDPAGTVSYTYDANGNVLTVTDPGGTITREYDALNRVKKYTDAGGNSIQYDYDPVGNLVSLTYPGGKQVRYEYDAANRLTRVTDWAGRVTSYEYDANGCLTKTTRPNGTVQTSSYDPAGQMLQQKDIDGKGNIIVQYDYTYDGAGNVTAEQSSVPTQPFNLTAAAMTYTTDNRLATYNGLPVEYDADGNMTKGLLGGVMGNYAYDSRNRLTSVGHTAYWYDAENNRTGIFENGKQTNYLINPHAPLSQVLIKTDDQGNQTFYVYGLGLIGQENAGVYHTYHHDRRGSTVVLSDISGNVTDRIQYSPYGTITHRTGNTLTPFQYNGKYGVMTDAKGLYHMRARYYNPEIRRFINQDILPGSIANGQSLNRYAYVNGNPVSNVDPFGLCAEEPDEYPLVPMPIPPGVNINQNINKARNFYVSDFLNHVPNKKLWDYKQLGGEYQDFGNFNYGATGTAAGFTEETLLRAAGAAQLVAGSSEPELWGYFWQNTPYGDDFRDQAMIEEGIKYYSDNYPINTDPKVDVHLFNLGVKYGINPVTGAVLDSVLIFYGSSFWDI